MKQAKMDAIKEMAKGDVKKVEAHKAKCPKCGHEWMMGEKEKSDEEGEYEDED